MRMYHFETKYSPLHLIYLSRIKIICHGKEEDKKYLLFFYIYIFYEVYNGNDKF